MPDISDHELLRRYTVEGSEEAFAELTERHCNLVWTAARRITGDGEAARDVAQTVFTDLARKSGRLPTGTIVAGWLYRAACLTALKYVRREARRQQHEERAIDEGALQPLEPQSQAAENLQPLLDTALAGLSEADRNAIVLRFLCGRSFAEVSQVLGCNEDTAQKRVSRALDRLRAAFQGHQVGVNSGIVAAALGLAGAHSAPTGLAAVLSHGALTAASSAAAGGSLVTLLKSKLALTIASGTTVAVIGYQYQVSQQLRAENSDLRLQIAALSEAAERPAPRTDSEELERLRNNQAELLRLRGEVARFRQELADRERTALIRKELAETILGDTAASDSAREFTAQSALINIATREIGLGIQRYRAENQNQLPATFDEIKALTTLQPDGNFLGGVSFNDFEFFPQPHPINLDESKSILVREKTSRRIPEDLPQHPDPIARRSGWERSYLLLDGTALLVASENNDFRPFEQQQPSRNRKNRVVGPVRGDQ